MARLLLSIGGLLLLAAVGCGDSDPPPWAEQDDVSLQAIEDGATRIYLMFDQPAGGPFLAPVTRAGVPREPEAVIAALLAGPTDAEMGRFPRMTSAIPRQTELLGVDVAGGAATVDFNARFGEVRDGDEAAAMAQVVYTLTAVPGIHSVTVTVEGAPVGGQGADHTRMEYAGLLPPIYMEAPAFGGDAGTPVVIRGSASKEIDEITVLVTGEGGRIASDETFRIPGKADASGRRAFRLETAYAIDAEQDGSVIAWYLDGSGEEQALRQHLVKLIPADDAVIP